MTVDVDLVYGHYRGPFEGTKFRDLLKLDNLDETPINIQIRDFIV